jgi:hypothetical protein
MSSIEKSELSAVLVFSGGGYCAALKRGQQCLGSFSKRDYAEDIACFEHKLRMH